MPLMDASFDANGCPCFLILLLYDNESELTFSYMPGAESLIRPCRTPRDAAVCDQKLKSQWEHLSLGAVGL